MLIFVASILLQDHAESTQVQERRIRWRWSQCARSCPRFWFYLCGRQWQCIGTHFFYYNSYIVNVAVMLFLCEIQWVFVYPGVLCWHCQIAFKLQSICCHNNSSEVVTTCCQNSIQKWHKLGAAVLTTNKPQLHLLHLSRVHITYCKELHLLHCYR